MGFVALIYYANHYYSIENHTLESKLKLTTTQKYRKNC